MKSLSNIILGLLLLLVSTNLFAQREQFILKTEIFPTTNVTLPFGEGEVAGFSSMMAFGNRSVLNEKGTSVLTSTLRYMNTQLNYDGIEPNGTAQDIETTNRVMLNRQLINDGIQLQMLQTEFLLMQVLNKEWMLYGLARPTLFTDFQDPSFQDFRFEAAFFTEYRFGRKFRGGLGLSRTSSFGRVLWIPLVRVVYKPARKIQIDGILPSRLDMWYIPSKEWELGFGLALLGGQFRISDSPIGANQFGWANGVAAFQVKRLLSGKWYVQADAGISLVPRQEFTDYDYKLFPTREILFDLEPDSMPVFRLGIFKVF